jgi:hypothetical protein
MARGTMHSQGGHYVSPGEVPLLYIDPTVFSTRFQFQISLFQMHEIEPFVKERLAQPANPADPKLPHLTIVEARLLGPCLSTYIAPMRRQLRQIWCGYEGPPPIAKPRKKRPILSKIRRGSIIRTSARPQDCLVVSHDFIHYRFPHETLILLPILDFTASQLERRYWFDSMHRLNVENAQAWHAKKYPSNPNFEIDIIKESIPDDEMERVLRVCRLILGIDRPRELIAHHE